MEDNKLRKLAGLPVMEGKKKKDTPVIDDAAPAPVGAAAPTDGDADDLPVIVSKIANNVCKKFGIGDPKGGDSPDLTAMQDFLMKVYNAGVKDGQAAKD